MDRRWLRNSRTTISLPALKKIVEQDQIQLAHRPSARNSNPPPIKPCTQSVMRQYALPCSHRIKALLDAQGGILKKENFHPRWWLVVPLDETDPLLRIDDSIIKHNPPMSATNGKVEPPHRLTKKKKKTEAAQTVPG